MAKISKKAAVTAATGLPSKEQILLSAQNTDKVPAVIQPQGGGLPQPAALTEGEFVFNVAAIIGAGDGDYNRGLEIITQIHDQLKAYGEELMGGGQGDLTV